MSHPPGTSLHLVADLAAAAGLDDAGLIEAALRDAAAAARAQVVGLHLHHFGPGLGLTGVAMLAESHISIHTWPEAGVAAVDLFVCGETADAPAGLAALVARLGARIVRQQALRRLGLPADGAPA